MSKKPFNEKAEAAYAGYVEDTYVEPGHDVAPNAWVADGSPTRQRGIVTTDREREEDDRSLAALVHALQSVDITGKPFYGRLCGDAAVTIEALMRENEALRKENEFLKMAAKQPMYLRMCAIHYQDPEREIRELEAERNRMEVLLQRIRHLETENEALRAHIAKLQRELRFAIDSERQAHDHN